MQRTCRIVDVPPEADRGFERPLQSVQAAWHSVTVKKGIFTLIVSVPYYVLFSGAKNASGNLGDANVCASGYSLVSLQKWGVLSKATFILSGWLSLRSIQYCC
jgi:hypothetical protein